MQDSEKRTDALTKKRLDKLKNTSYMRFQKYLPRVFLIATIHNTRVSNAKFGATTNLMRDIVVSCSLGFFRNGDVLFSLRLDAAAQAFNVMEVSKTESGKSLRYSLDGHDECSSGLRSAAFDEFIDGFQRCSTPSLSRTSVARRRARKFKSSACTF